MSALRATVEGKTNQKNDRYFEYLTHWVGYKETTWQASASFVKGKKHPALQEFFSHPLRKNKSILEMWLDSRKAEGFLDSDYLDTPLDIVAKTCKIESPTARPRSPAIQRVKVQAAAAAAASSSSSAARKTTPRQIMATPSAPVQAAAAAQPSSSSLPGGSKSILSTPSPGLSIPSASTAAVAAGASISFTAIAGHSKVTSGASTLDQEGPKQTEQNHRHNTRDRSSRRSSPDRHRSRSRGRRSSPDRSRSRSRGRRSSPGRHRSRSRGRRSSPDRSRSRSRGRRSSPDQRSRERGRSRSPIRRERSVVRRSPERSEKVKPGASLTTSTVPSNSNSTATAACHHWWTCSKCSQPRTAVPSRPPPPANGPPPIPAPPRPMETNESDAHSQSTSKSSAESRSALSGSALIAAFDPLAYPFDSTKYNSAVKDAKISSLENRLQKARLENATLRRELQLMTAKLASFQDPLAEASRDDEEDGADATGSGAASSAAAPDSLQASLYDDEGTYMGRTSDSYKVRLEKQTVAIKYIAARMVAGLPVATYRPYAATGSASHDDEDADANQPSKRPRTRAAAASAASGSPYRPPAPANTPPAIAAPPAQPDELTPSVADA